VQRHNQLPWLLLVSLNVTAFETSGKVTIDSLICQTWLLAFVKVDRSGSIQGSFLRKQTDQISPTSYEAQAVICEDIVTSTHSPLIPGFVEHTRMYILIKGK